LHRAFQCSSFLIPLFQYYSMVVDGNLFNLNDILNTQMMPLNVFLMGFNDKLGQRYIEDFLPALHTMGYHRYFNDWLNVCQSDVKRIDFAFRKMMQQFMASDYLSKQILNWKVETNVSIIRNRAGKLQKKINFGSEDSPDNTAKLLLFDTGSSSYNDWLKR